MVGLTDPLRVLAGQVGQAHLLYVTPMLMTLLILSGPGQFWAMPGAELRKQELL